MYDKYIACYECGGAELDVAFAVYVCCECGVIEPPEIQYQDGNSDYGACECSNNRIKIVQDHCTVHTEGVVPLIEGVVTDASAGHLRQDVLDSGSTHSVIWFSV